MSPTSVPHILIVGGGFAGVYATREFCRLRRPHEIRITLLSERNYFLFTPLLHEVATGGLSPASVAEPLVEVFRGTCVTVLKDSLASLDRAKKTGTTKSGQTIPYDYLILATGSTAAATNIPGVSEYALPLKNLTDALRIRSGIIKAFDAAANAAAQGISPQLSFAVVGAGHTGVETVLELSDFVRNTLAPYYRRGLPPSVEISVSLFGDSDSPAPHSSQKVRTAVVRALEKNQIRFYAGATVKNISKNEVELEDGSRYSSQLVIWTAGIRPAFPPEWNLPVGENGRVKTQPLLTIDGDETAYAVGDLAGNDPCLAQAAVQQGAAAARNIIARIRETEAIPYRFEPQGFLMSLGRGNAAGEVFGFFISGPFAWWVWRTVYWFKFLSWRKRLRIAFDWTLNLFTRREITSVAD